MARQQKVATGFTAYAQTKLLQKAQQIVQCLTNNVNFPNPVPALTAVSDAITAYETTLTNVPGPINTKAKLVARNALTTLLNQLAMYVQMHSNNDTAIMLTSGFSLTKMPQPIGVLPKPENFKVLPLHNSRVKLSLKKIFGADSYCFEYASAPVSQDSNWASILSTKANTIVSDLNSGSQYVFRVSGVGSNPVTVYSDEVTSYIL